MSSFLPYKDVEPSLKRKLKAYVFDILGCCIEVRKEMGCWFNEYIYQDALAIALEEAGIAFTKEYRFYTDFHGIRLSHYHQVDFYVKDKVFVECKAVTALCADHRQQLWNYMRLTKTRIGILYNFAPYKDQVEKYYYDPEDNTIGLF